MWKVIFFCLSTIHLNGQAQDPLEVNIEVVERIKSYYFPNENNFAFFLKTEDSIKFIRFHNTEERFQHHEEVRLILISLEDTFNESEFLFVQLVLPTNLNTMPQRNKIDYNSEVLRAIQFGIIDGIVSFESESDFEPE